MSTTIRKHSSSQVMTTAVVASLSIVFAMVVATGIWMKHAVLHGNVTLAGNLRAAHFISGILFILLGVTHLWQKREWMIQLFCISPSTWKLHAHQRVLPIFVAAFICTAVSALLVAFGVGSALSFHCGVALLFSVLAVFHIVINIGGGKEL